MVTIVDAQTNLPIKDVNVYCGNKGITTNKYGSCSLNIFNNEEKITFSIIGYKDITIPYYEVSEFVQLEQESIPMELVNVFGSIKNSKKRYSRLEINVRKVYPYAKKISDLLVEYSPILNSLEQYPVLIKYQKKRKIFSAIENQLFSKYGYSIKRLKKSQGRILIKLIDRETSKTSYNIIKDFRNVFSASFWQFTAKIFGHNLRSSYNPSEGENIIIEHIIKRIENENFLYID